MDRNCGKDHADHKTKLADHKLIVVNSTKTTTNLSNSFTAKELNRNFVRKS